MEAASITPLPESGQAQSRPPRRFCLSLAVGWGLLGAAACANTFVISTIPAPLPDGRSIPFALQAAEALLALTMVPLCLLIPVPLLIAGRNYLRRSVPATRRWVTAWSAVAAACAGIEALFLFRLALFFGSAGPGLPHPSWHALAFAIGFLAVGTAMTYVLINAGRTAARPSA